jgi:hypothetical protein
MVYGEGIISTPWEGLSSVIIQSPSVLSVWPGSALSVNLPYSSVPRWSKPLVAGYRVTHSLDYEYWMRIAKRFRIGYLGAYLANSRLHSETKPCRSGQSSCRDLADRQEALWIRAGALALCIRAELLCEKLMPYVQGYTPMAGRLNGQAFSCDSWERYRYFSLEGVLPADVPAAYASRWATKCCTR